MSFDSPAVLYLHVLGLVLYTYIVNSEYTMMASLDGDNYHAGDITMKLEQEHIRVMEEELKLHLLVTLKNKGLSTRDIMSFTKNQADSRQIIKGLDKTVAGNAMTTKIRDCKSVISKHRKIRNELKAEYIRSTGAKRNHTRKVLRSARTKYNDKMKKKEQKIQRKIEHLESLQLELDKVYKNPVKDCEPTRPPERLKDYSDLSIFGPPSNLPPKQAPLGPYICDDSIILSEGERRVLSKDPKYSLMMECSEEEFDTESERALAKHRYGIGQEGDKNEKKGTERITQECSGGQENNTDEKLDRMETLKALWQDSRHRHIYNPFEKTVNFRYRRPTDYKMNTRVKLPRPLSMDQEFHCETRRRAYKGTFDEYRSFKKENVNGKVDLKVKADENTHSLLTGEDGNKSTEKTARKRSRNSIRKVEKRKNKKKKILNLTKLEREGHDSLLGRIKDGEIIITPTDKSGRLSVMTKAQYMKAGEVHTSKDQPIGWDIALYLKNQVNSHMWWLTRIVSYSKNTDQERMFNNLIVSGVDIPEMSLLVKDHKIWQRESDIPVPTRPVVSGNVNINTHLSELISEILEPIALELEGNEIQSSEEALARIDSLNSYVKRYGRAPNNNEIARHRNWHTESNMAAPDAHTISNKFNQKNLIVSGASEQHDQADSGTSDDERTIDALTVLGLEAAQSGNEYVSRLIRGINDHEVVNEINVSEVTEKGEKNDHEITDELYDENIVIDNSRTLKTKITDYFSKGVGLDRNGSTNGREWLRTITESSRKQFSSDGKNMNKKLLEGIKAGRHWNSERELSDKQNLQKARMNKLPLQEESARPVFFGSDVVALYPNLEPTSVARIAANAVRKSKVHIKGINYYFLIVYLFLVLGVNEMSKAGLSECIPKKKKTSDDNIKSLAAEKNRDLTNWNFDHIELNEEIKVELLANMVQIMVLLLTSTTCYKFAGGLFRQVGGLGIGLRASAALARVAMCTWDILWGRLQAEWGLSLQILFRYVDDIRMYMRPLRKGWKWVGGAWSWSEDDDDERSPEERTIQEVGKSLNSVWEFLSFTTEGEKDFDNCMLPTLDFATHVENNGYLSYQFFSKPMSSNLVLEKGTALSTNCVFSSLRQDLVRRLYNTDIEVRMHTRIRIIENFIQQMVNSGHKYQYIKSVVLQAISKYVYMVQRSKLATNDRKYAPLHRMRSYRREERLLLKYTNQDNWYTGVSLKDQFRNGWKAWIKRKSDRRANNKTLKRNGSNVTTIINNKKPITSAIFIPSTVGGKLSHMIQQKEDQLTTPWAFKVIEKPGMPLARTFKNSFEMTEGCSRKN